jgi:hypothetical protein
MKMTPEEQKDFIRKRRHSTFGRHCFPCEGDFEADEREKEDRGNG